jgi:hypothetical protein
LHHQIGQVHGVCYRPRVEVAVLDVVELRLSVDELDGRRSDVLETDNSSEQHIWLDWVAEAGALLTRSRKHTQGCP